MIQTAGWRFRSRWLKLRRSTTAPQAFAGAQALAERILQRYALRGQARRGLGMQYLHAGSRAGLPQALRLALNLTTRIERFSRTPLEMRLPAAAPSPGTVLASALPGSQPAPRLDASGQPAVERTTLIHLQTLHRLRLGSHQRLELGAAGPPLRTAAQPAAASVDIPLARPVSMISRLAPPAPPAAASTGSAAPPETSARRSSAAESSAQAVERNSAGLPPAELRRVTEQVIQEIDKRIVANRERFGRT